MKSVETHLADCLEIAQPLPPFDAELPDAVGCMLAEDVRATHDVPYADLAARDGYALIAEETTGAGAASPTSFRVMEDVYANSTDTPRHLPGTAIRIASGARLPIGANAVVPLDFTDHGTAQVQVFHEVRPLENVRAQGQDMGAGDIVCETGTRVSARHVALLASAGRDRVRVRPAPRVVVMSIGDELVAPGQAITPGKTYDANSHALAAAVKNVGGVVYRVPAVSDDKTILRDALEDQLVRADVIITTGGLSYGGGDTVKEVLSPLGSVRFDNVSMNPGRQFGVGTIGDGTLIFCLPGDPVAALIAFEVFVRPALRQMAGHSTKGRILRAQMTQSMVSMPGVRDYVRVRVSGTPSEGYVCEPVADGGLALLTGLAAANGLAIVPESMEQVREGEPLECIIFAG
ncbi:molybdopterin molybdotransferase MoeA [Arcanobacterium haemolyticum]|nr:molybdopterin molybdotransferase MoeA [Arcanobacterium haemolyticum]